MTAVLTALLEPPHPIRPISPIGPIRATPTPPEHEDEDEHDYPLLSLNNSSYLSSIHRICRCGENSSSINR